MKIPKSTILKAGIIIYPALEILNGYINGYEPAKLITNSYILFFLLLSATLLASNRKALATARKSRLSLFILVFLAFWIAAISFQSNLAIGDLTLVIRSFFFGSAVALSLESLEKDDRPKFISTFCFSWWTFTTTAIFLSGALGIGLYTYEAFEAGRKFYFQANNELSIFYSSISAFLIITQKSLTRRTAISILSIACFLIIGVKSFALTAVIITIFFCLVSLDKKIPGFTSKVFIIITPSIITASLIYFNIEATAKILIDILGNHSSASSKIIEKANHLGALSAALGERDVLISKALDVLLPKLGTLELFFGFGFSKYTTIYGSSLGGEMKFVENDLIDIFFSYGVLGSLIYSYILISAAKKFILLKTSNCAYQSASTVACLNALILGAISGHGVLFSFPCLIIALFMKGSDASLHKSAYQTR